MKIEVHIYHHLVRDEGDCDVLQALAEKLRKSTDNLASAVALNTPTDKSPQPEKGEK
jgi:hypothetical protein